VFVKSKSMMMLMLLVYLYNGQTGGCCEPDPWCRWRMGVVYELPGAFFI